MSQLENKMDDFAPFGGKALNEHEEDGLAIPIAIDTAVINALDDIMFPMDDRGERPLECQTHFAVQRTFGAEGKQDYFLLSDAERIGDEIPFSRDGASWGECDGALAIKAYSEPPCVLTFHEVSPAAVDSLRDEDGLIVDVTGEQVEKVYGDELLSMPPMLTLLEVELKVEDALAELEAQSAAGESLDDLAAAKVEESSLDAGEDCGERTDRSR